MTLMVESADNVEFLVESSEDGNKKLYITGNFLQSEVVNRNRRWYPKDILAKEVNRFVTENVKHNRAIGELNHADTPSVNLDKVSHKIVELKEDGNNWIGKALILNTPTGNIAKGLIEGGVQLGVSSRGLGTLKPSNKGYNVVQEDYYLATIDLVSSPSGPDCFVNGLMESKDWIYDNGIIVERKAEEAKKIVEQVVRKKELSTEKKLEIFESFIQSLLK